jgi:hypothetical protein
MAETAEPKKIFTSRVADKKDEAGIWNVLVEVAADIPARVEKPEDQEYLKGVISTCVAGSNSWVAVDSKGVVIGLVLSTPDNSIRNPEKKDVLNLPTLVQALVGKSVE